MEPLTLEEIRYLFKKLGPDIGLDLSEFADSVTEDFNSWRLGREAFSDQMKKTDGVERDEILETYSNRPLEYFLLRNLAHQFLLPLSWRLASMNFFRSQDIKGIDLRDELLEQDLDSLQLTREHLTEEEAKYDQLLKDFDRIGKELMGDSFHVSDFLK